MQESAKKYVALGIAVLATASLVYGTYLPYRRSTMYIHALQSGNSATTVQEFLAPYLSALSAPGPIGDEELVRNFAGVAGSVVENSSAGSNETLVRVIGAALDRYVVPVVERKSGLSQAQSLYTLSGTYRAIDAHDDTQNFRERYHQMLLKGYELSPDRPQFLYGLLDYELRLGKDAEALKYAQRITELWPEEKNAKRVLKDLQK